MLTGHTPRRRRKKVILRHSTGLSQPTKTDCVESSCRQSQDKSLDDDSHSAGTSISVSQPSTPSGASVSAFSSRALTPSESAKLWSTADDDHTSISVFPEGNHISVKRAVSGYKSTSTPLVETDVMDCDKDYEDMPNEGVPSVDMMPKPEKPPAKQSRTTDKSTTVSPWAVIFIYGLHTD